MSEENVYTLPNLLERLRDRIRIALSRDATNHEDWISIQLDLCTAVAAARVELKADVEFGKWFDAQGFLLNDKAINDDTRAAMWHMGEEPDILQEILQTTDSRSLDRIWRSNKSRFRSPPKPRRHKSKGSQGHRKNPDAAKQAKEMFEQGATEDEVSAATGLSAGVVNALHREVEAAKQARKEEREKMAAEQAEALKEKAADDAFERMAKEQQLRFTAALDRHKARLDKQFKDRVYREVRQEVDRHVAELQEHWGKLVKDAKSIVNTKGRIMPRSLYKTMLMVCHPDNSASPEKRREALEWLIKNEVILVLPEKPINTGLPNTYEEWDALWKKGRQR